MTSIPNEVIHDEILHKLPAKSLVRFKCVSKSFNTLISSPEFIDLHLRQSLSSDANRLLILGGKKNSNLYSIDIDSLGDSAIKIPLPRTLNMWLDGTISIVGSFNGLLCVGLLLNMGVDEYKHVLINPSTGVYREIPRLSTPLVDDKFRVTFGFGFDELNDDYKLVRVFEYDRRYDGPYEGIFIQNRKVMVYSLNEDSWKSVEDVDYPLESLQVPRVDQNGVLLKNNLLHWVFWDYNNYKIRCFDVQVNDWVNDVPLMDLNDNEVHREYRNEVVSLADLGVLYECLSVSTSVTNYSRVVWIMKEYGVQKSWVKLFGISHHFDGRRFRHYVPLGFRQGSNHKVLVRIQGTSVLFWRDIESGTCNRTHVINEIPDFKDACFFMGSLVPIPGGEKIQTSYDQTGNAAKLLMLMRALFMRV